VAALPGILKQQGFRLLDAREGQIMGLHAVAVIFDHLQVSARGVEDADDDDGEEGKAPE
jgi:hypothetical protein